MKEKERENQVEGEDLPSRQLEDQGGPLRAGMARVRDSVWSPQRSLNLHPRLPDGGERVPGRAQAMGFCESCLNPCLGHRMNSDA